MPSNVVDIPLDGKSEEELNIKEYQEALVDFINTADAPLTIALQGEWGSGKTSLMNYLKYKLSGNYHVIEINTWQYSMLCTPDQAVVGILKGIVDKMGVYLPEDKKNIIKAVSGKLFTFATTASVNILGQLVAVPEVGSSILEAYKSCLTGKKTLTINDILPQSSIVEELKEKIKEAVVNESKSIDYKKKY